MAARAHDRGPSEAPSTLEVSLQRAVAEGVVLGRDATGRVVLARGGLPGEEAEVEVHSETPTLVRGEVTRVRERAAGRVEPPCIHLARGCGGCDLQHATRDLQRAMRAEVVTDALRHTGSLPPSVLDRLPITEVEAPLPAASRTTMRMVVCGDGSLGLRRFHSHEALEVPGCLVAHPLLGPAIDEARFEGPGEVTLRASVSSGEVMAVTRAPRTRRGAPQAPEPSALRVPGGVRVVSTAEARAGGGAWLVESVEGTPLRVSAGSFFQSGPVAAAALCRAVGRALGDFDAGSDRLVDLYGGVGLFTARLGAERAEVVEWSRPAAADARVNTAALGARVTRCDVGRWRPRSTDALVADPARSGLGRTGADAIAATGARTVALVSCDPASMARDLTLLHERGYEPTGVELVEMFPHTHHVESVTALVRGNRRTAGS
ncbi:MAG: hypothetical protein R2716_01085 [Microthrixaceae bacterium]